MRERWSQFNCSCAKTMSLSNMYRSTYSLSIGIFPIFAVHSFSGGTEPHQCTRDNTIFCTLYSIISYLMSFGWRTIKVTYYDASSPITRHYNNGRYVSALKFDKVDLQTAANFHNWLNLKNENVEQIHFQWNSKCSGCGASDWQYA